jgi:hypothetical protein
MRLPVRQMHDLVPESFILISTLPKYDQAFG